MREGGVTPQVSPGLGLGPRGDAVGVNLSKMVEKSHLSSHSPGLWCARPRVG